MARSTRTVLLSLLAATLLFGVPSTIFADEPIDNERFRSVIPDGFEIISDALEKMGMMTITYSPKYEGLYLKFEGNGGYTGDPMKQLASYAKKQDGTDPVETTINDIVWAWTTYEYGGLPQTMMVTNHDGTKVTITIIGPAYGEHQGITKFLDELVLK